MAKQPKIARTIAQLTQALREHVELLQEYALRAFQNGEEKMLKEVAGKLRVLVYESRTNKPLLLSLMDQFGLRSKVTIDRPLPLGGPREMSLPDWLKRPSMQFARPNLPPLTLTRLEFLSTWAQQEGAAHEDWEHDEAFAVARTTGVKIGRMDAEVYLLQGITKTVLEVANHFLGSLTPEMLQKQGG